MHISWSDWIYPLVCVAVPSAWAAGATVLFRYVDRRRAAIEARDAAEPATADSAPPPDYSI